MKFLIKDFFSKCDQIRRKPRIWSHLLKKSLMENFIFCAVKYLNFRRLFHITDKYQISIISMANLVVLLLSHRPAFDVQFH